MPGVPELPEALARRIRLVRRDMGGLLFHFTRTPASPLRYTLPDGTDVASSASASSVLWKILREGTLLGTGTWTDGEECICFTEAPIHEFNSVFSLVELAASEEERPRYEPYGVAVPKEWLFRQGGRPVIYDHPDAAGGFRPEQRYRFVPYDPAAGIDFTWEREWRVRGRALRLDPRNALVVVPSAEEAFELVYGFSELVPEYDDQPFPTGAYHDPRWLAVSLDLFGLSWTEPLDR